MSYLTNPGGGLLGGMLQPQIPSFSFVRAVERSAFEFLMCRVHFCLGMTVDSRFPLNSFNFGHR